MNIDQVHRAMETMEDVFTSDDDAVTLGGRLSTRNGVQGVKGSGYDNAGGFFFEKWYPFDQLTAKEDL